MDVEHSSSKTLTLLKKASIEHSKMVCPISRAAFCSSKENTFYVLSLVEEMKNIEIVSKWLLNVLRSIWPHQYIVEEHNFETSVGYVHVICFGIFITIEDSEKSTSVIIKCNVCSTKELSVTFNKKRNFIKVNLSELSKGISLKDDIIKPDMIGDILTILVAMIPKIIYRSQTKMDIVDNLETIVKIYRGFSQEHFIGMVAILTCTLQQMSTCERLAKSPVRISRLHPHFTLSMYDEYGIVNCNCKIVCQICKCQFCFCVAGMRMFGSFLNYTVADLLYKYEPCFAENAQKLIELFPGKSPPFIIGFKKSMKRATFEMLIKCRTATDSPSDPINFLISRCTKISPEKESLEIHFVFDDKNKNFPSNIRITYDNSLFIRTNHVTQFLGILMERFDMGGKEIRKRPFTYHEFLLFIGLISFLM